MKYLKGGTIVLVAILLGIGAGVYLSSFNSCIVPFGYWNFGFLFVLTFMGIVYILDESRGASENSLAFCVKATIVGFAIAFFSGDIFLLLVFSASPHCIHPVMLVVYLIFFAGGTMVSLFECYNLIKGIIE